MSVASPLSSMSLINARYLVFNLQRGTGAAVARLILRLTKIESRQASLDCPQRMTMSTRHCASEKAKNSTICLRRILRKSSMLSHRAATTPISGSGSRHISGRLQASPGCTLQVRESEGGSPHTVLRCMSRSRWARSDRSGWGLRGECWRDIKIGHAGHVFTRPVIDSTYSAKPNNQMTVWASS